ncbi:MAG TPA: GNAT family N-acetyltransferase [Acidimicrobiales bacterium]|nr:GNAT family N-acetyltransferase [Acidimicrobiales bacterium]
MTWSVRPADPAEATAVADLLALGFGQGPTMAPHHRAAWEAVVELDRTLVVEDEGRIVGTGTAHSLGVALPGGAVPMAGVSEVAVSPTHRRRGILAALLDALHRQAAERGEPVAGLTASEGGIYRRFGYGVATRFQAIRIDAHRSAEAEPVAPVDGGRVRFATEDEAATILPEVWERHWPRTPGEVRRTPGFWVEDALDPPEERGGASARFVAVHTDEGGRPDGFVTYRIAEGWGAGGTNHEARILLLAAASDAVEAALLRFVLDIDLVGTVTWNAPVDLPLRWRLADPRAVTVHAERDLLWLRPLDVPGCLEGRGYAAAGEVVLEVVDERGPAGGRYLLEAGPDGARCRRVDRTPDLVLPVAELGSLLAGGTTWHTLARAGRVREDVAGSLDRADALFRTARAAYCATEF